ncbi:diguanylate cyclase (GGDEF)-like protein [Saccharopolyspora lacisalsi]|uniref:Diguanylate cyclase (GGDEF)-like protein n=1 Tax=Halosaccharopolyspora lacisalsi TaxID=1000566 RepID=A0A839E317_9PSEU|nr:GGDEF domain-containing protein [Halosaccharopolyspora lacisalsi]MBA8827683.1 diguanylate cyclase (GGDEF)-like protein [Halosaccharopolyspora lacisalsi]
MSVVDASVPSQLTPIWDELIGGLDLGVLLTDAHGQVLATNDVAAGLMRLSKSDLLTGVRPYGWSMSDDTGSAMPDWAELAGQVLRAGSSLSTPAVIFWSGQPSSRVWIDYHPVSAHGRDRALMLLRPVHTGVSHGQGLLDPLTGLPGRALLLDRLEQTLVRSRVGGTLTTLVIADVRRLSAFNNEHGFAKGDRLLAEIAAQLRQGLRDDQTVARYGGDEFAVIADHPTGAGVDFARRVREVATRSVRIEAKQFRPNLRVSWVTTDGQASVHSVIERAQHHLQHS